MPIFIIGFPSYCDNEKNVTDKKVLRGNKSSKRQISLKSCFINLYSRIIYINVQQKTYYLQQNLYLAFESDF